LVGFTGKGLSAVISFEQLITNVKIIGSVQEGADSGQPLGRHQTANSGVRLATYTSSAITILRAEGADTLLKRRCADAINATRHVAFA